MFVKRRQNFFLLISLFTVCGLFFLKIRRSKKELSQEDIVKENILRILIAENDPKLLSKKLSPYCKPSNLIYKEVLESILSKGFKIRPHELYDPTLRKVVYLRHDVHARDIPNAACMMIVETELGVSSGLFIEWPLSDPETQNRKSFAALTKLNDDGRFKFGLHPAAEDAYFSWKLCGKNSQRCLRNKLREMSDEDLKSLVPIYDDVPGPFLQDYKSFVKTQLTGEIEDARKFFPHMNSTSAHGGIVRQELVKRFADPGKAFFIFRPQYLLGVGETRKLGINFDIDEMNENLGLIKISDNSGDLDSFKHILDISLQCAKPISALIHPNVWQVRFNK